MAKLVSKTYGEALFDIAMEEQKGDLLLQEAEGIRQIIQENPEFDKLMKHPGIAKQEKLALMEQVFKGRISEEMTGFLTLVISKERYRELPEVFDYFLEKMKEEKKIGTAYVTTAVPLSESQKEDIRRKLLETTSYLTMEIHYQVDAGIIGGMIVRIKDRVVDSSIRTKLNDLTKQLLQIQLGTNF